MSHVAINSNTLTAEGGWGTIGTGESEWAGNTPTGWDAHTIIHTPTSRESIAHTYTKTPGYLFSLSSHNSVFLSLFLGTLPGLSLRIMSLFRVRRQLNVN